MTTVSHSWTNSIIDFAIAKGVSEADIRRQLAFELNDSVMNTAVEKAQSRVDLDHVVELWSTCARLSSDPCFGLSFGQHIRPKDLDVVGFLLMTSKSLSTALESLVKYQSIVSQGGLIGISEGRETIDLWYQPQPLRVKFSYHQIDAVLCGIVTYVNFLAGKTLTPVKIEISHNNIKHEHYMSVFGCHVEKSEGGNFISYPKSVLNLQCVNESRELNKILEGVAEAKMLTVVNTGSIVSVVCSTIYNQFGQGEISKSSIAAALNMSLRTMQRRLEEQNVTFKSLLEFTRKQFVLAGIRNQVSNSDELATYLGFCDTSSFYKAFKRWTGKSIKDFY